MHIRVFNFTSVLQKTSLKTRRWAVRTIDGCAATPGKFPSSWLWWSSDQALDGPGAGDPHDTRLPKDFRPSWQKFASRMDMTTPNSSRLGTKSSNKFVVESFRIHLTCIKKVKWLTLLWIEWRGVILVPNYWLSKKSWPILYISSYCMKL